MVSYFSKNKKTYFYFIAKSSGESYFNLEDRIGGDSELSPAGEDFALRLGEYVNNLNIDNVTIWTSWLKRAIQTASHIQAPQER